ncbi:MAG: EamA family transporter [Chitinophagaceae bacterium]
MNTQNKKKAYLALAVTSFIWGTTWVVSKVGVGLIHPVFFSSIRQFCGGSLFLLFFLFTGKATLPKPKEWAYILMMSFLLFVISNGFTVWSMRYLNSGLGAILGAIFPLFVAIIEWMIGDKDRPNWVAVTGLLLGFGGVAIIFSHHLQDFFNSGFRTGILFSLIATITWAAGTVLTTRNNIKLNRYYSLGWQMLLSGIIMFSLAHLNGWSIPLAEVPLKAWACIGYMVVFGSIIAFGCFIYTITHLPTTLASIYAYINPMVAVLLGHFILKEELNITLGIGALVTIVGVFLVNRSFKKMMKEQSTFSE